MENKDLLLKVLCDGLPYGLIISPIDCGNAILIGLKNKNALLFDTVHNKEYDKPWDINYIKPYLRDMEDMTEEEKEYFNTFFDEFEPDSYWKPGHYAKYLEIDLVDEYIDWLNKKHFNWRGLPESMYIKVTEENNPYKE